MTFKEFLTYWTVLMTGIAIGASLTGCVTPSHRIERDHFGTKP